MADIGYTPVFEANRLAYESHKHRVIGNEGSTRSSKTFSINQLLSLYIPERYQKSISIVGPSLPHLKRGARRDFLNILQTTGLYDDKYFNKTDQIYTFPKTGSYVEFFGVEDGGKVRGPGRNILYVNEANLIDKQVYKQLALRTTDCIFMDYNPADEFSWVYDEVDKPGNKLIHSTYKNNLANLTKEQVEEIESLEEADENLWRVFGLGLRGTSSETIYTHWKTIDHMPECDEYCYGLDFGYNHPTALVKIGFKDDKHYAEEMIYETKLTTEDLIYLMGTLGITNTHEIFADAAEPKTIESIYRAGFNIKECDKKSVKEGIKMVQAHPLFFTRNSPNLIKEAKSYKWKVDKNDIVLDEPVKVRDDGMDALRYGIFTKLSTPRRTWTAF